jgi:DHA3 family tetracycline resistance protein-like MFS transporter
MRDRAVFPIYVLLSGASSLFYALVFTVNIVYQVETVRLNPLQLVLVGTLLESVCFLFQVPTGILADMYSRRRAVVLGILLIGAGFLVEGSIPRFAAVLVAQVLWGLGATLKDGADAAWVADEVGAERAGQAYLRAGQFGAVAALLGVAASVGLASVRLNLPIVLGGVLFLALGAVLARLMPERHFVPAPREDRGSWQQMGHMLRAGVRVVRLRPVLLTILGIGVFYGMFTEGFDRLWQYHLLHNLVFPSLGSVQPVVWFGLIQVGVTGLNLGATEIIRRRVDTNSHRAVAGALCALDGLLVVGVTAFAVAGQFALAVAAYWLVATVRSTRGPLEQVWMNQRLDARVRATVFSLRGQVDAFAQIVGGPILGAIAAAFSTRSALLAAAVLLAPALLLYARTVRSGRPLAAPLSEGLLAVPCLE